MPAAVAACKGVLDDCGLLPTVTTQWYGYSGHHDLDVFIELGRWKRGALLCVDWAASGGSTDQMLYFGPSVTVEVAAPEHMLLRLGDQPRDGSNEVHVRVHSATPKLSPGGEAL